VRIRSSTAHQQAATRLTAILSNHVAHHDLGRVFAAGGNGYVDTAMGEQCDDGNTTSGDGCSADCLSDETCGNGYVDTAMGEQCDDGNNSDNDACLAGCVMNVCGDGLQHLGVEACDDGNTVSGDGCSADCLSDETCGNEILDISASETCDGSDFGNDSCQARGYYSGSLNCSANCVDIDDSGCSGSCGDGICEPGHGEIHVSCPTDCPAYVIISAGAWHNCSMMTDETAWCWGGGTYGRLGNGSTASSSIPVQVAGLTNVVTISSGGFHNCAMAADGAIWCWGHGTHGQLGNGSIADSSIPVQVTGLTNAIAISAGGYHSCAVVSDGTVWCWGYSHDGQLGNGSSKERRAVPLASVTRLVKLLSYWNSSMRMTTPPRLAPARHTPQAELAV
jgi:cysteine-rich repeat protein